MDNGIEFRGLKLKDYTKQKGIQLETTVSYTLEQDSIMEYSFRTLFKWVYTVAIDYGVPKNFWPELVKGMVYLMNYTATTAIKSSLTLLEVLDCYRLDDKAKCLLITHIPALGYKAFINLQKGCRV